MDLPRIGYLLVKFLVFTAFPAFLTCMGIVFRRLKWILVRSSLIRWDPGMNLKTYFAISHMVYSHAELSYLGYVFHILSV